MLASGLLFTTSTSWPGYLAAVPTPGTAAVIAAGFTAPRGGPAHMLGVAPMRWFGRMSYSIHLWHWVVLYLAAITFGGLPLHISAAATAASVPPRG